MKLCMINKWSKKFDDSPHRRADFLREEVNVTPASREQCNRLQQSRRCRYWFFGCVHRSSNSQCFSMGRTTPKMHFRLVGSGPHLIHGFLGPRESTPPKRHLDQFCRLFTVHQYDQRTDRQTVHATCDIFRSRPHLCYACDAT